MTRIELTIAKQQHHAREYAKARLVDVLDFLSLDCACVDQRVAARASRYAREAYGLTEEDYKCA